MPHLPCAACNHAKPKLPIHAALCQIVASRALRRRRSTDPPLRHSPLCASCCLLVKLGGGSCLDCQSLGAEPAAAVASGAALVQLKC